MSRRGMTSIGVALLLALAPATAFAQGAGDEQYQDPLAAPTAPKKPKKKTATTAPTTTTPTTTTPAATTAPAATSAPTATSTTPAASTAPAAAQELPRTGAPAGLIGAGGIALIASGAALRRRSRTQ